MGWDRGGERVPKGENQCVCLCLCVFVVSKQRHSVHSAFRESVMQARRQPPFSILLKHFNVLFIRGGKASGVFNSTTTATAAEISVCFFSSAPDERGTFVLEIMCWKMSVL